MAFHAAVALGGVVTPISPALTTADELARQLADAGASYLLTAPDLHGTGARRRHCARACASIFVLGEAAGVSSVRDVAPARGTRLRSPSTPAEDLAVLPYSSGTTGLPKGVMLTHRNLVANTAQVTGCGLVSERDTVIAVLPFFHMGGLMAVLQSLGLATGATLVTLPRFELALFLTNPGNLSRNLRPSRPTCRPGPGEAAGGRAL